jgi:DNA-binding MarR family transcriptional regulator
MDTDLVDRALRVYGEAINLVEPLRVRFWHEHGLTIAQMGLLFVLYEDARLSVGELAERLHTRPATVTGLVTRLERAGYVHRGDDEVDRRVVRVTITAKGRNVLEEIRSEGRAFMHRAFVVLGESKVATLADLLTELVDAVTTATNDAKATMTESAGFGR